MIVQCDTCSKNYNDAERWTLCPHPKLDDWEAREQIQNHREAQEKLQQVQAAIDVSQTVAAYEKSVVNEKKAAWEEACVVDQSKLADNAVGLYEKPNVVETTSFQNKAYKSYANKNQCQLSRNQLLKLCEMLGLSELHKTQRIILDVDCEGIVRIYSKAMMMDSNFDIFNLLLSEENE